MENPIGKLDDVLNWLAENSNQFWKIENIIKQKSYKEQLHDVDDQLLHLILEKMVKDGNASLDTSIEKIQYSESYIVEQQVWLYKISFEGLVLHEQGGYKQKKIRENAENTRLDTIEKNQKFHRNALTWLTFLVALGTLIAAAYYLLEIGKYFCWWQTF